MSWISWPLRMVAFLAWFAWQVVVSNVAVLRDNLTPGQASTPGVARVVTRCRTDAELTGLAGLVTLTPGTLTLGTGPSTAEHPERVLYVHGMYHPDAASLAHEVATIEARFLRAWRREEDRA
ncbi:Na+/H+ antiporter subunit E [Litorihabitans aurantiacus]|uniref:Sodium:proton antiporter n=1 Tax=Litorihabitans aurantiacus TaxID=1930061 RepID=A0AA38CVI1_9MICO|nr:Na+/H+ antiporter subunit E [Litorihabitans aurantiacus]GMA32995.1 hypothetical protein GCM10025875_29870 [Litorihabitans aurantiacus]